MTCPKCVIFLNDDLSLLGEEDVAFVRPDGGPFLRITNSVLCQTSRRPFVPRSQD